MLARLGGLVETAFFEIGGQRITATFEHDVERTTADGKTSAVHFLHFPFTEDQIVRFRDPSSTVVLGLAHANYAHMALLSAETRGALADDFD
jgi:mannitol/fructose-specific phosphotransferase system IIA component